ncbi:MAG: hypothetical protein AB7G80_07610 [Dongiaceae bacterium]
MIKKLLCSAALLCLCASPSLAQETSLQASGGKTLPLPGLNNKDNCLCTSSLWRQLPRAPEHRCATIVCVYTAPGRKDQRMTFHACGNTDYEFRRETERQGIAAEEWCKSPLRQPPPARP